VNVRLASQAAVNVAEKIRPYRDRRLVVVTSFAELKFLMTGNFQ
jgi:hypothetical protein